MLNTKNTVFYTLTEQQACSTRFQKNKEHLLHTYRRTNNEFYGIGTTWSNAPSQKNKQDVLQTHRRTNKVLYTLAENKQRVLQTHRRTNNVFYIRRTPELNVRSQKNRQRVLHQRTRPMLTHRRTDNLFCTKEQGQRSLTEEQTTCSAPKNKVNASLQKSVFCSIAREYGVKRSLTEERVLQYGVKR